MFSPLTYWSQICFFLGIALVVYGWTITGFILEGFGFINLFG